MKKENCSYCDFLVNPPNYIPPSCSRVDKPLHQLAHCETGQMVKFPTSGLELGQVVKKTEMYLRGQGQL